MTHSQRPRPAWTGSAPLTWVGDFVRAQHDLALDREAAFAVLRMLGFDARLPAPEPQPAMPDDGPAPAPPLSPPMPDDLQKRVQKVLDESQQPLTPHASRVYSECVDIDAVAPAAPPWLGGQAALDMSPQPPRAPAPLFDPVRRRSILVELLARRVDDGAPDVPAIVRSLSQGRALHRLPRRPRRTLAFGVELLLDGADAMQPFRADGLQLAEALRQLLPEGRLQLTHVRGAPPAADGPTALPRSTVLAVTDFGAGFRHLGPRPAAAAAWLQHAQRLAAADRRLRALVPLPPARWPAPLARRIPMLHWAESSTLGDARRARQPRAVAAAPGAAQRREQAALDLATVLSPALRIDAALLRSARRTLLPTLGPEAEADLWFGPWVSTRGPAGITLGRPAQEALARRLAGGEPVAQQRAHAVLDRWQHARPESLRIEEELRRGTLDDGAIERVLRPAFKALADGGDAARTVAAWVPQAWQRLPAAVRSTAPAQQLALAASVHLGAGGWLRGAGDAAPPAGLGWLLPDGAQALADWAVELREYDGGEVVVRFTRDTPLSHAVHRVQLPAAEPVWLGALVQGASPPALRWQALQPGSELAYDAFTASEVPEVRLRTLHGRQFVIRPQPGPLAAILHAQGRWLGVALSDDLALMVAARSSPDDMPGGLLQGIRDGRDARLPTGRLAHNLVSPGNIGGIESTLWIVLFPPGSLRAVDGQAVHRAGQPAGELRAVLAGSGVHVEAPGSAAEPGLLHIEIHEAAPDDWALVLPGRAAISTGSTSSSISKSASKGRSEPIPVRAVLHLLRDQAVALRRRHWVCRLSAAPDAAKFATELRRYLGERLPEWRITGGFGRDAPTPREQVAALRPDVLVIIGPHLPDAETQALIATGLPVLWAPMGPDGAARLQAWPAPLRDTMKRWQWLKTAQQERVDAGMVAEEIAGWSPPEPTARPAPPAASAAPVAEEAKPGFWSSLTRRARRSIVELMEDKLDTGLHRVELEGAYRHQPFDRFKDRRNEPVLLLLHGDAANGQATFGALWEAPAAAELARLRAHYGFALVFEYRSLSRSLVDNAIELAAALPAETPLHVLGHSAGGVLGELLLAPDPSLPRHRQPRVEHLVRVASPLRGMDSLSKGLARVSGLGGILGALLPLLPVQMLADQLQQLYKDPASSPGLADVMPGSAVLEGLNGAAPVDSRLTLVAGETSGGTLSSAVRRLGMSLFSPGATRSDLVVDLAENFGGLPRMQGLDYFINAGSDVTHFNFFKNAETRQLIVDALLGQASGRMRHAASYDEALRTLGLAAANERVAS